MKSIHYINLIIGLGCLGLTGCAEAPIAKTNCWVAAPHTTVSSKGVVSRAASSPSFLVNESNDATDCE